MKWEDLWDQFTTWVMHTGMPVVQVYHLFCGNVFINTAAEDAQGVEKIANATLIPVHYLFVGKKIVPETILDKDGVQITADSDSLTYKIEQRFDYDDGLLLKSLGAIVALPVSLPLGCLLKGIAYVSSDVRNRHHNVERYLATAKVQSNNDYYRFLGLPIEDLSTAEPIESPRFSRRPGDENVLKAEKEGLKEVVKLLKENNIPFWVDCGTCIGALRYGGVIPWDFDIDLAVLQPDFENVRRALNALDKEKYIVQDWSSRDKPNTYLKVYIRETGVLIDIYHYAIDPVQKTVQYIISNEDCIFLAESWKIRERRFKIPTPISTVFPLKKATFDGIEVFVPNKTKEYLQLRYGQNIDPAKVYNSDTGKYEKDLTHPYWAMPHAH